MSEQATQPDEEIVRVTVTLTRTIDTAIRELAATNDRPLSREIRRALEAHIERESEDAA